MVGDNNIDYYKLVKALTYYKSRGFKYLDLNWVVSEEVAYITKPKTDTSNNTNNFYVDYQDSTDKKMLVGSAEQTFLQMIVDGQLEKGRYVGMTPCFRDEVEDKWHSKCFMKVELIDTKNVTFKSLNEIIDICLEFYNDYIPATVIKTGHLMYDIVDSRNHIELGSYGIREHRGIEWIYATGCAEPRLSKAMYI